MDSCSSIGQFELIRMELILICKLNNKLVAQRILFSSHTLISEKKKLIAKLS